MATVTAPVRGDPPRARRPRAGVARALSRAWAVDRRRSCVVLTAVSAYIRTRYISGQFWMDEAITTGIASHSLSAIPGLLRHDGSPPLFYVLLHFWIRLFGAERVGHARAVAAVRAADDPGRLLGRLEPVRAARRADGRDAVRVQPVPDRSTRSETRMYELMGLLGILATAGYIHGFVYRRRKYLILFALCQALMLYTHAWGIFFGARRGARADPDLVRQRGPARARPRRGAGVRRRRRSCSCRGFRTSSTRRATPARRGRRRRGSARPVLLSRDLIGGDRITIGLVIALVIGLAPFVTKRYRRTREATMLWTLIALPFATLLLAWLASQITPAFVSRYFAPVLASILLLAAWGCARAGIVGLVAIVAVGRVRRPHLLVRAAVQERHARRRRRDGAAACIRATS